MVPSSRAINSPSLSESWSLNWSISQPQTTQRKRLCASQVILSSRSELTCSAQPYPDRTAGSLRSHLPRWLLLHCELTSLSRAFSSILWFHSLMACASSPNRLDISYSRDGPTTPRHHSPSFEASPSSRSLFKLNSTKFPVLTPTSSPSGRRPSRHASRATWRRGLGLEFSVS